MKQILIAALFAGVLFIGVLACLRIGWRLGRRRLSEEGESGHAGLAAVDGAVFGLVGLLIAFTFTGAATRFDQRRLLMTQQVNAIGTAWLRLDLLNEPIRTEARALFRQYVDAQLEVTREVTDVQATSAALAHLAKIQDQIWAKLMEAVRTEQGRPFTMAVLPPVNEMFDVAQTRLLTSRQHPHPAIYLMLGWLVLVAGLMAGFGMAKAKHQSPLHRLGFAAIMALSVYLILDLEFPRLGLIRVDSFDQALVELRATMQ